MNVHHLELFYYVAKYEGITNAANNMPYGIMQPAISGQIKTLEESLGVTLFNRRPFYLTPAGEDLYDSIYKFFSRLDSVAGRIRGEERHHLRLAAAAAVLTDHLPVVLKSMQQQFSGMRLTLRDVRTVEIESVLQRRDADIAVALLQGKLPASIQTETLLELPLVILAPADSPYSTFAALAKSADYGEIKLPLISLPPRETLPQMFQSGLEKQGLMWVPQMEVSSFELIQTYVAGGFGYGITVDNPGVEIPAGIRRIRLKDFPSMRIGLLHTGKLKPIAEGFAIAARHYARELKKAAKAKRAAAKAKVKATSKSVPAKKAAVTAKAKRKSATRKRSS